MLGCLLRRRMLGCSLLLRQKQGCSSRQMRQSRRNFGLHRMQAAVIKTSKEVEQQRVRCECTVCVWECLLLLRQRRGCSSRQMRQSRRNFGLHRMQAAVIKTSKEVEQQRVRCECTVCVWECLLLLRQRRGCWRHRMLQSRRNFGPRRMQAARGVRPSKAVTQRVECSRNKLS